ncbi:uncharacterized protein LOC129574310 isoform X1 [Sitodiplosis mosellana]|uniref:uncharacterized protein LOC129574310 isoform X1 n=1 Tax=Sitodiplosis mosellana TaxID=263140 RepID=UPI002443EAFC|nr:uncharacterized protein LOC129574310 isoform X1 [Sitodiplosis mosellana]
MRAAMEPETQHRIEVLSKRRCSTLKLQQQQQYHHHQQYNSWTNSVANHRFQVLRRIRKRQFFQPKWHTMKPAFMAHESMAGSRYKYNGGYSILWELNKIDRQINVLQSQIGVLKQQLRIIQTQCVPTERHDTVPRFSFIFIQLLFMFIELSFIFIGNLLFIFLESFIFSGVSNENINSAVVDAAVAVSTTVAVNVDHQLPNVN